MIGMSLTLGRWMNVGTIQTASIKCGFCSDGIATDKGYLCHHPQNGAIYAAIYICPRCNGPTFRTAQGEQIPGAPVGRKIDHLPKEVAPLFDEARRCFQANAFTACVMCCRIILMHIAVQHGAVKGEPFVVYVDFLVSSDLIPRSIKEAATQIRKKGNAANHDIEAITKQDAEEMLYFLEVLLINIYEVGGRITASGQSGP